MNDLVFAFNFSESKKSGCIVIDSYICNSKFNKQHKYSGGRVTRVSIWDNIQPSNYTKKELEQIRTLFRKTTFTISSYQYLLSAVDFFQLIQEYSTSNFYYYVNALDMYLVERCSFGKEYKTNAKDTICQIRGYDIVYNIKKAEITILPNGVDEYSICDVEPVLKVVSENSMYRIVFEYQGIEIPYDSNDYIFEYRGNIIIRKLDRERKLEKEFAKSGFKKKRENSYEFIGSTDPKEALEPLGIEIESATKNTLNKALKVDIKKNGYDWFDLKLSYQLGDKAIELGDKIDLFSNKKTVTVDGIRIELPDSVTENIDKLVKGENGLIIPASNFWTVLQIAGKNQIDFDEFVSYKNIDIAFDDQIEQQIREHQREGVRWLKWLYLNHIGGCLADDMGTGKTFQAIAFLSERTMQTTIKKVLIVVPYVLMENWLREFRKFSKEDKVTIYHGNNRFEIIDLDYRIIITTYATATNDIELLQSTKFDVVIFDEIQYLKNNDSKTYKALSKLDANTRIGLSGTPIENRIDELWSILNILNPGMLSSKREFLKKYKNYSSNELHSLLNPFILRRTKDEVVGELPEKQEVLIYSEFSERQRALYDSIRVAVKNNMSNYTIGTNATILKGLLLLREVCCHPLLLDQESNIDHITDSCKFESLKIAVREIVESGNKVIIYSQFVKMLNIIRKWCDDDSIDYYYMDGETSKRQEVIDSFESSDHGVFLISLKAGGVGLNLTSAHFAIIYDPWWNPFVEQQAEDRIYRIGQEHDVTIYKMIVSDSIEEKILQMQESKRKLFSDVLDGISNDKIDLRELVDML